jgi:deoxyribodipyrimidine photolyase-related protein
MKTLIPVLGDQLSLNLSSLAEADPADSIILMVEVSEETGYVAHHKAKLAYILSAMRHHATALREAGWVVDYVELGDAENSGSFTGELARAIERHQPTRINVTEAGEWRVKAMLDTWAERFDVPVNILPDDRFLCDHAEFETWADGRKQLRMEYFYRDMRRKSGLLMEDDKPAGGQWNFDAENRKPAKRELTMPRPLQFEPDAITREVITMVEARIPDNMGRTSRTIF